MYAQLPGLKEFRLKEKSGFICSSQTFTVTRTADKWFVSFALDVEKVPPTRLQVEQRGRKACGEGVRLVGKSRNTVARKRHSMKQESPATVSA